MKNITMNTKENRTVNGGATIYGCPMGDYYSTSFWKTYGHAIGHAAKKGIFDLPFWMIKTALGF